MLANVGTELFEAAGRAGVDLLFEASVAGGIPLIRPLRESLAGEKIRRVTGIVNGTTNFILTQMSEEKSSFTDALAEAQSLGYAERDPTADVEGYDAAAKAAGGQERRRVYVGDSFATDVVGSKAAGWFPILFDRHGRGAPEPVVFVTRLVDLKPLL